MIRIDRSAITVHSSATQRPKTGRAISLATIVVKVARLTKTLADAGSNAIAQDKALLYRRLEAYRNWDKRQGE
jgi:hypothetical protein